MHCVLFHSIISVTGIIPIVVLAACSRCMPWFCFMLLMKASFLAFVLPPFFSQYVNGIHLFISMPDISLDVNTQQHSNEEATCDFVFLKGFNSVFVQTFVTE